MRFLLGNMTCLSVAWFPDGVVVQISIELVTFCTPWVWPIYSLRFSVLQRKEYSCVRLLRVGSIFFRSLVLQVPSYRQCKSRESEGDRERKQKFQRRGRTPNWQLPRAWLMTDKTVTAQGQLFKIIGRFTMMAFWNRDGEYMGGNGRG